MAINKGLPVMHVTILLFLGLLFPALVRSDSRFRRPPGPGQVHDYRDNNAYILGEWLDISWDMEFKSAKLLLWQEYDDQKTKLDHIVLQENTTDSEYKWQITEEGFVDPGLSHIFFFELVEQGKEIGTWAVTSHYFNLTEPSPAKKEGLSAGTALGIGIGATLAAVLLIGVVAWLVFRRLRNKRTTTAAYETQPMVQPMVAGSSPPYVDGYLYDTQQTVSPMAPSEWKSQASQLPSESHELHEVQANNMDIRHEMHAEPVRGPIAR